MNQRINITSTIYVWFIFVFLYMFVSMFSYDSDWYKIATLIKSDGAESIHCISINCSIALQFQTLVEYI